MILALVVYRSVRMQLGLRMALEIASHERAVRLPFLVFRKALHSLWEGRVFFVEMAESVRIECNVHQIDFSLLADL